MFNAVLARVDYFQDIYSWNQAAEIYSYSYDIILLNKTIHVYI